MCRALIYLGQPVLLDDLLFKPESALVNQAYMPRMLHMLNLAGFGMLAWDRASHDPEVPFRYASPTLPVFDRNLKSLAGKVRADCVLAHVRGVAYSPKVNISLQNTHPFCFEGSHVALAHNGDLYRVDEMRRDLLDCMQPAIARQVAGTTDSELIYGVLISRLAGTEADGTALIAAVKDTLATIRAVRARHGIDVSSSVNLFIATRTDVVGVRYCFDFGCYRTEAPAQVHEANLAYLSMWYTTGRAFGLHEGEWKMIGGEETANSLIIASEPLTHDTATWVEVPEYSLVHGTARDGQPVLSVHPLPV
jgi:predicted glutamine amidotransferase